MDDRRKRLLYQANHMGMKETDALLGGYATLELESMDEPQVAAFEQIMKEGDNDLMNWLLEREPFPAHLDETMMQNLIQFKSRCRP